MWRTTSRMERTRFASPPEMTGMWRKPPTDMLCKATASVSLSLRTTGSGVISSRTARALRSTSAPAAFSSTSRSVRMPTSLPPSLTRTEATRFFCMPWIARATGSLGDTAGGSSASTSASVTVRMCSVNSSSTPGRSRLVRSLPQLSQESTPGMLSVWQSGQIIAASLPGLVNDPGIAFGEERF